MSDRKSTIVPYVVPKSYVTNPGTARLLGHDIWAVLAEAKGDLVGGISAARLGELGVGSVEAAWSIAFENLDDVFTDKLKCPWFPARDGVPKFILCGGHWLAGSCLVLPRLHAWASRTFDSEEILVSVPQREALVIFPKGTRSSRAGMREKIRAAESDARKLITWELFSLDSAGVREFHET